MTTRLTVPTTAVSVTLDARALFNPYGHVTAMACDNSGPRLTIRLHDGTRLVLEREGDDWILGPDDGEDILAVTTPNGPDNRMTAAAHEAIDELWHAACSVIDQLAAPVIEASADNLARLLDRAMGDLLVPRDPVALDDTRGPLPCNVKRDRRARLRNVARSWVPSCRDHTLTRETHALSCFLARSQGQVTKWLSH